MEKSEGTLEWQSIRALAEEMCRKLKTTKQESITIYARDPKVEIVHYNIISNTRDLDTHLWSYYHLNILIERLWI